MRPPSHSPPSQRTVCFGVRLGSRREPIIVIDDCAQRPPRPHNGPEQASPELFSAAAGRKGLRLTTTAEELPVQPQPRLLVYNPPLLAVPFFLRTIIFSSPSPLGLRSEPLCACLEGSSGACGALAPTTYHHHPFPEQIVSVSAGAWPGRRTVRSSRPLFSRSTLTAAPTTQKKHKNTQAPKACTKVRTACRKRRDKPAAECGGPRRPRARTPGPLPPPPPSLTPGQPRGPRSEDGGHSCQSRTHHAGGRPADAFAAEPSLWDGRHGSCGVCASHCMAGLGTGESVRLVAVPVFGGGNGG